MCTLQASFQRTALNSKLPGQFVSSSVKMKGINTISKDVYRSFELMLTRTNLIHENPYYEFMIILQTLVGK